MANKPPARPNDDRDPAEDNRSNPPVKTSQAGYGHKSNQAGTTTPQGTGANKDKQKVRNARRSTDPGD